MADTRVLIFSDSKCAINAVVRGGTTPGHEALTAWARRAYRALNRHSSLEIRWVRGHTAIWGNELADKLAKEAAKLSVPEDGDLLLALDDLLPTYPPS
jgi:ribonuclease HI